MFIPAAFLAAAMAFPAPAQVPTVKASAEEVLLDLVVRDKKGKPITDLKPEDITILDNGVKQTLTSFRLVSGSEAVSSIGSAKPLDALCATSRLVTLAFEAHVRHQPAEAGPFTAALDLIKGEQRTNVFYSVVVIDTRLLTLPPAVHRRQGRSDEGHRTRHRGASARRG